MLHFVYGVNSLLKTLNIKTLHQFCDHTFLIFLFCHICCPCSIIIAYSLADMKCKASSYNRSQYTNQKGNYGHCGSSLFNSYGRFVGLKKGILARGVFLTRILDAQPSIHTFLKTPTWPSFVFPGCVCKWHLSMKNGKKPQPGKSHLRLQGFMLM